jgi:hypothetical protein
VQIDYCLVVLDALGIRVFAEDEEKVEKKKRQDTTLRNTLSSVCWEPPKEQLLQNIIQSKMRVG